TIQIGDYTAIGERVSSGATVVGDNVKPADASDAMIQMQTTASAGGRAIELDFTKGIAFHASTGSTTAGAVFSSEVMRIANNGNVGIGTPTPQQKLDVNGTVMANQLLMTNSAGAQTVDIQRDAGDGGSQLIMRGPTQAQNAIVIDANNS